jgi:hypothetical protein
MNKHLNYFRIFPVILLVLCIVASCQRLPNVQGKGEVFMQGIWNQDSVQNSSALLNYTQHRFKITCDSFYVELTTHSKVNYYPDSCFNNGVWKEYAKGIYVVRNDSLFLEGTYTKSNYKQKVSGCYQTGRFVKSFFINNTKPDTLFLQSTTDQRACTLILKEKIICTQKPL